MSEEQPIRVLLVDDHAMVRRGLATFLLVFDDLVLAGEAANGLEAIHACARLKPDIVLMDLAMPEMDGVAATRQIRQRYPEIQVIALTSFKEMALIQNALHAGALGYLLKDVSADELAQAIRSAHAGQATLSPDAVQALVIGANQPPPPGHNLTKRERTVLALLVRGLNNTEIAAELVVSPATIKSHVSHILAKLGVASRTEAAAVAIRHHLLD